MKRFLAGVMSALLLMTAGLVLWSRAADADDPIPPPPRARPLLLAPPAAPPSAPATPEKTREQKRFSRYDDNENGLITRAEMMETRRSSWERLDTNKDGRLDFEEWAVTTSEKFAKADADKSGTLNADEFLTTRRKSKPRPKCTC